MSDNREGEEEEDWSREEDELIPRSSRNRHDRGQLDDGDDQIPGRLRLQRPGVSVDQRKERNSKDKDKKWGSQGNRRKIQAKAKQLILSPVRRFDKQLEGLKNRTAEITSRRPAAPFPYDGEDFGGSSRYLCFLPPSIRPPSSSSMAQIATASSAETHPGAGKPADSSYYYFLKALIEKNDFYSPECNVHRDITSSESK